MKKVIVTISREFGSGGRLIGFKLSELLGINLYDRALILLAAEKTGLSPELIENVENSATSNYYFNLSQAMTASNAPILTYDLTPNGKTFLAQTEVIKDIASRESAIIVGCCADYILKDEPGLINIYLYGEKENKFRRLVDEYGLSEKEAKEQMKHVDKGRESYYRTFTGATWGDPRNNDICINTSRTGIEGAVAAIIALVNEKTK